MKKLLPLIPILALLSIGCWQNADMNVQDFAHHRLSETDSLAIINTFVLTEDAWNTNNLEGFMEGYWKSDRLVFVGSRGATYGYDATLDSYKRGYPDPEAMGRLKFDVVDLYQIDEQTAIMIGKFYLTRTIGDMQGYYTLVWQKIDGKWLIISDHSSGDVVTD